MRPKRVRKTVINVTLNAPDIVFAFEIGGGNRSEGIRRALEFYRAYRDQHPEWRPANAPEGIPFELDWKGPDLSDVI